MKIKFYFFLILLGCCQVTFGQNKNLKLWYDHPGDFWNEALPVGNGRLGAMVFGKTTNELIQLNEETLWSGQPHDYSNKEAYKYLHELRQLINDGKNREAHRLGNEKFMSNPIGQFCYQPLGNIHLNFPGHDEVDNYYKELDINSAIVRVSYSKDGIEFNREIFSSYPDSVLVVHLTTSQPGSLNFEVSLSSPHKKSEVKSDNSLLQLSGTATNYQVSEGQKSRFPDNISYPTSQVEFFSNLKVLHSDGQLTNKNNILAFSNASAVTLVLTGATNFINYNDISGDPENKCKSILDKVKSKSYAELKQAHIEDYQSLFHRLELDLGSTLQSERPTDQRIATFTKDMDPNMVSLLYQYGRYLMISSSRKGTQPANLQGIWNAKMSPPWDSKYTININTEMNYWLAEMTNLSECADPLIDLVKDISVSGRNTAKFHYNMDGWVTHHNTDLWRGTAPINNADHGIWVTGGAWLTQHLWWRYEFTKDESYLKSTAYPIMKEASIFFTQYLTPDKNNPEWLISGPSNSPEIGGLVMGPTMDHQIIRNLFANTIEAAHILNDEDFAAQLEAIYPKIAPNQIGKYGQLQEWTDDKDDPQNKHRHVSHLWGLHPGNEIHPLTTPDLAQAAKVTLAHRGDEGTGWSRAWKINFWARLLDGDHAFSILKNLILPVPVVDGKNNQGGGGLYPNMLDAHPPFQIDGNFGATSGITEMLLQSHLRDKSGNYYLDILPALPKQLQKGSIKGLRAKGGFEIDISWENGQVTQLKIKSLLGSPCLLRYSSELQMVGENAKAMNPSKESELTVLHFKTLKDKTYTFTQK